MAKALTKIEPLALPDPRKPATMPSLPGWAAHCSAAARPELQLSPDGKSFEKNEVMVVPAELVPSPEQRRAMQDHLASLRCYLAETPENGAAAETSAASQIAALLMVKPASRKSELGAEARADVYLDVLDDVPWWALKAAIRKWHKHDCGKDERGRPYDYHWAPDPGDLRRIAYGETWPVKERIREIEKVLAVRAYVDCSAQLADGQAAWRGLSLKMGDPEALKALTWGEAVRLGKEPPSNPAEKINMPAQAAAE